ncbi:hypothetical protein ACIRBX_19165 [Kitasatospora sp. NPDC096147]|uniref:hypothetical protein n=1 Tax=Kitasatospora sp. NPDC096147 TaxID=3364093 RepID=UPI00382D665C
MKHRTRITLVVGALAMAGALGAGYLASADTPPAGDNSAAPHAVEDFAYPNGNATSGIRLQVVVLAGGQLLHTTRYADGHWAP